MTTKPDYRTRAGREQEILAEVAINGGFTTTWAKETPQRAAAINRLQKEGRIRMLPVRKGDTGEFLRFVLTEPKPKVGFWQWFTRLGF